MPKLTSFQLKYLLLKGVHLLAVILIMAVLVAYFHKETPPKPDKPEAEPVPVMMNPELSAYEQFCLNNQDAGCVLPDDNKKSAVKVILMDTGELDDELREKIAKIALNGCNTSPRVDGDMQKFLDYLYEEDLPEDIIDETAAIKNPKLKNMHIIPARKPPFWGKTPKVVLIIDDMGISQKRTADIAELHYPLTVAFLTYGRNLSQQIENSKRAGQEIMLHTPMEALGKVDVAPDVLTTKMSLEEIKHNFKAMLDKFPDIQGINNHMGSKLTEDLSRMNVIMEILKERNMFFLDSKTSAKSRAEEAARAAGIAYAHRHVFLDNNNDKTYILGQLDKVEKLARKNGYAIAIGHPKSQTYAALKEWLPKMKDKGLELIHLSEAIKVLHPWFGRKAAEK